VLRNSKQDACLADPDARRKKVENPACSGRLQLGGLGIAGVALKRAKWSAARAAWLVTLALAGCSARHLPATHDDEDEHEGGGGAGAQADSAAPDAPPWLIEGRDARLDCPLANQVEETLAGSCPLFGNEEPCHESDEPCTHYDATSLPGSLMVCRSYCRADYDFWVTRCSHACGHECPEPPAGAVVVELDHHDCTSRPVEQCRAEELTVQDQLDRELQSNVLGRVATSEQLVDQSVVIYFENGCATRVHLPDEQSLPFVEPVVRQELEGRRLSCAETRSCGMVHGPQTLP
jgi:hypothetical protein